MGQATETAPADASIVVGIVDDLAIGLTIHDASDGRLVYANRTAMLAGVGGTGDRTFASVERAVEIGGCRYDVVTAIDVTEQRRLAEKLADRAFFDELTGLPKGELIQQTVEDMVARSAAPFALSFIDVDNFKFVNDYYGHAAGDRLLKKIAERIAETARPTDVLARVGGDEFVFVTTPIASLSDIAPEIERLSARFKDPFFIDGSEIFISASIGVSLFPLHGRSYETLRASADSAMYRVKEIAKGGVKLFDAKLSEAATARMEVEQRLRGAIRDKRICCAFQPKIDFRSDRIVGLEVLLRWRDEDGVNHLPGAFITLAIELGLMDSITMIILQQVIDQIDLINDAFGPNASISLNVAAKQAGDLSFMIGLAEAIRDTGYPERFILELTEEAFLSKGDFQSHVLPILKEIGIGVSIDDFGVGYSSLSALAEITADELKVDRSFITGIHNKPRNQSILRMIELLGTSLGMRIVVEGIETFEELAYIEAATRISCAQGYYFAKPMFLQEPNKGAGTYPASRPARAQRFGAPSRAAQDRRR